MKDDKQKEVEELERAIERVSTFKRILSEHPLIKKYSVFTGLFIGFVCIVLFFNNSMIGVGSVETKDYQVNHLEGIGGSVETKSAQSNLGNSGIGADKINSKDSAVSNEDAYAMDGTVQTIHVYNATLNQNQILAVYHTDETTKEHYDVNDISGSVVSIFDELAMVMSSQVSMLVMLMIVGMVLSITMGVLFRFSRIMGFD